MGISPSGMEHPLCLSHYGKAIILKRKNETGIVRYKSKSSKNGKEGIYCYMLCSSIL